MSWAARWSTWFKSQNHRGDVDPRVAIFGVRACSLLIRLSRTDEHAGCRVELHVGIMGRNSNFAPTKSDSPVGIDGKGEVGTRAERAHIRTLQGRHHMGRDP